MPVIIDTDPGRRAAPIREIDVASTPNSGYAGIDLR